MTGTRPTLLSIGELASASGLSAKALRLYDESGLLPPAAVDPFTGYRSYGADQVARARLIAGLRRVGMGLDRIRVVCDLPPAEAAAELRSWWHQEEADVSSRATAVVSLVRVLEHRPKEAPTMHENTSITTAVRTDQGPVRASQQDAALALPLPGGRELIAVADGFGPGDDLSTRLLETFSRDLERSLAADTPITDALGRSWSAAEQLVSAGAEGAGSTLTAAVVDGATVHVAHIGDSRALLVRGDWIEPITQDHTHVRSLLAAGRLTREEAETHPEPAVLNRALAVGAPTAPDLLTRHLEPGSLLVLLTDGVHAVVDAAAVAEVLTAPEAAPDAVADALVERALAAGGPDNVAVAVARIA